jgi:hypothetical protein
MPSKIKSWDRGRKKPQERRQVRRVLILSEDEKSSVDYLKQFPFDPDVVRIECVGTGMNTDTLVAEAIDRKERANQSGQPYQEIWVVFDRDSSPLQNFNRSFDLLAPHREITACWSNECFELWYLLHFRYQNTGIARDHIYAELGKLLGKSYEKSDRSVYEQLLSRLETAMNNALRLQAHNARDGSRRGNPSTNVHELIRRLQQFDPAKL